MASTQLKFVKDFFTGITPDSNVVDHNGNAASITNNIYGKIDRATSGGTSTYMQFNDVNKDYKFKLTSALIHSHKFRVKMKVRGFQVEDALTSYYDGAIFSFYLNDVLLGSKTLTTSTDTTTDDTFTLTNSQINTILQYRNQLGYNIFKINAIYNTDDPVFLPVTVTVQARIYAIEIYYENTDNSTYSNSDTGGVAQRVYSKSVPSGTDYIFISGSNTSYLSGHHYVLGTTSGTAPDGTYIQKRTDASGSFLQMYFEASGITSGAVIKRADLYLRYNNGSALTSGNCTDGYEVYGYHSGYPTPIVYGPGQFLSGSSGFYTTSAELAWLNTDPGFSMDPAYYGSTTYKDYVSLNDIEFRIVGIPSGGQISAAELIVNTVQSSSENSNMNLYTVGGITESGTLNLYTNSATLESGTMNLYTSGNQLDSASMNLYVFGAYPESGTMNLFAANSYESGAFNLYTSGNYFESGGMNLYTVNATRESGNMNLYISGAYVNYTNMNLYISGTTPIKESGNLLLSMNNNFPSDMTVSGVGYARNVVPMYILSQMNPEQNLNLMIQADPRPYESMNLYIYGAYGLETKNIPLFVNNLSSGNSRSINLFAKGRDSYESGTLNLYIARDSEAESKTLNLVLNNTIAENSGIYLFTVSNPKESGNINLFTSGKGKETSNLLTYIRGF